MSIYAHELVEDLEQGQRGYGEVRLTTCDWVLKCRHAEATCTNTRIAAAGNGRNRLLVLRSGRYRQGG